MRTELIKKETYEMPDREKGYTLHKEFKCPCGKGKIIEEHDEIVGFREHAVWMDCPECKDKYRFDVSQGVYNWELEPEEEAD